MSYICMTTYNEDINNAHFQFLHMNDSRDSQQQVINTLIDDRYYLCDTFSRKLNEHNNLGYINPLTCVICVPSIVRGYFMVMSGD